MPAAFATDRPLPTWRARLRRWRFTLAPPSDPWARVCTPVNWRKWPAAPADWRTIFSGPSAVRVASLAEVCAWLAGCRYCPDEMRGDGRDRWMHPLEFEASRLGDCEDHALWAWRKLTELGFAAEFVLGLAAPADYRSAVNHAWVHVHDGTQGWLLEGCARPCDAMLLPLTQARVHYLPAAAIDHQLQSHAFANLYHLRAGHALLRLPS
ncbi:MAG: hypothetical protein HZA93_28815 [Verrucomicrobia bacterium]|nr:hypothetical protein [Verrucomicrobiota bacterium]